MSRLSTQIIKAGLIVGTLDIFSACLYYYLKTGGSNPLNVLKFVASGVFGKTASTGGSTMIIAGLIFHYIIAFSFTAFFFWLFPRLKFLSKHKILTGIVYGLFAWSIMNLVVIPLSNIPNRPFNLVNSIINAAILIVCIGIPLSFMAHSYYRAPVLKNPGNQKVPELAKN
ncbi:hypothetical protein [Segetibacter aerophilus]|uniref:DUF1440 domain-containing protein n=1 Tax=Segetibacter aerophilus TaxID=670293 RepID=A0A512BAE6_9BACT|nr:hypothetical protein [Segetibacter aerophilus]GEO08931.1 hypothetical protein SAE01_14270 [Segetibacter aerophilus]